jgi:hypothetical protein
MRAVGLLVAICGCGAPERESPSLLADFISNK